MEDTCRLLSLSVEIRRMILLEVLRSGRCKEPTLEEELVQDHRVRLWNCFDEYQPKMTNIYVQKQKIRFINANAVLATCRQLRIDVLHLIDDTLKPGRVEVPFELDIMVIKDVGIMPTWISFPYKPLHIRSLRINLRIVRTGAERIPQDWIEAARYKKDAHNFAANSPSTWNLFVTCIVYSMNHFARRPPLKNRILVGPRPKKQKVCSTKTECVDAYLLQSAPYTVDEIFIDWNPYEYMPNGDTITRDKYDDWTQKGYYSKAYFQFTRDWFFKVNPKKGRIPWRWIGICRRGMWSCFQLEIIMKRHLTHQLTYSENSMSPYTELFESNIGVIKHSNFENIESIIVGGAPSTRASNLEMIRSFVYRDLFRDLMKEETQETPNQRIIQKLRIAKRRLDRGWWVV